MLKLTITMWITVLYTVSCPLATSCWILVTIIKFLGAISDPLQKYKKIDIFYIILNSTVASNGGLQVIHL